MQTEVAVVGRPLGVFRLELVTIVAFRFLPQAIENR